MTWWHLLVKSPREPDEGKELAKRQLEETGPKREVADAIHDSSVELAQESRFQLFANHFGPNTRKAFQEGRKE